MKLRRMSQSQHSPLEVLPVPQSFDADVEMVFMYLLICAIWFFFLQLVRFTLLSSPQILLPEVTKNCCDFTLQCTTNPTGTYFE